MNANQVITAVGGVALGVGGTLLGQKLYNEAKKVGANDLLTNLADGKPTVVELNTEAKQAGSAVPTSTKPTAVKSTTETKKPA